GPYAAPGLAAAAGRIRLLPAARSRGGRGRDLRAVAGARRPPPVRSAQAGVPYWRFRRNRGPLLAPTGGGRGRAAGGARDLARTVRRGAPVRPAGPGPARPVPSPRGPALAGPAALPR